MAIPFIQNLSKLGGQTRQLPNGGGSFDLSGLKDVLPTASPLLTPNANPFSGMIGGGGTAFQQPYMGAPVGEVPQPSFTGAQSLAPSSTSQFVTQAPTSTTPTPQTVTQPQPQDPSSIAFSLLEKYKTQPKSDAEGIYEQWMRERSSNTGMFALPQGVTLTPDQLNNLRSSADQYYSGLVKTITDAQKSNQSTISKFSVDSVLSGLSVNGANRVNKLTDAFDSAPIVKNYNTIQGSALKAQEILRDIESRPNKEANAGDDMQLMFLFAKAQDPDSVVRESEYSNVADYYSNLPTNVKYKMSTLYKATPDGKLTPESRKAMFNGLNNLYNASTIQYDNLRSETIRKINDVAGNEIGDKMLTNYSGAYTAPTKSSGDFPFTQDANGNWVVKK